MNDIEKTREAYRLLLEVSKSAGERAEKAPMYWEGIELGYVSKHLLKGIVAHDGPLAYYIKLLEQYPEAEPKPEDPEEKPT